MTQLFINPEYLLNKDDWTRARDLYEGKHDTLSNPDYLWLNTIETKTKDWTSQALRAGRAQRTRYLNISEIVVSLWQSLFFKEPPKADEELTALLEPHNGINNIDGKKTSLASFVRNRVLPSVLNYGRVYISADSYPISARNLKEQQEKSIRPFLEVLEPLNVVDWCIDYENPLTAGGFQFFRHEYTAVTKRMRPTDEPKLRKYSISYILDGNSYIQQLHYLDLDSNYIAIESHRDVKTKEETWQDGGEKVIPIDAIPVAYHITDSWLKDVNEESLRFHNIRSNKDNILHQQGYAVVAFTGIDSKNRDAIAALSEYTKILLPENGNVIQLQPTDTSAYERAESQAMASAFKMGLNKLRELPSDSKAGQAADSIDKENQFTFALVESELESIKNVMDDAFKHYARFLGDKNFTGGVELNTEISDEDFNQFRDTWFAFKDLLSLSGEVKAEVAKKALGKLNLGAEVTAALEAKLSAVDLVTEEQKPINPIDKVINGE